MMIRRSILFFIVISSLSSVIQSQADVKSHNENRKPSSPFLTALKTLQEQIGYNFQTIGLLRRAMTHGSYSEESNKALSMLGMNVIDTSVCLRSLGQNIDMSAKDLNDRIKEVSQVNSTCTADGMRLGLQKVVRVAPKMDSSAPVIVCGAFRAIFGAIAVDTGKADTAGDVFWNVHSGKFGRDQAFY